MANAFGRILLVLTQALTFIGWAIFLGALSRMQWNLDNFQLAVNNAQQEAYRSAFEGARLIDYDGNKKRQFGYQWWYISYQFFTLFWALIVSMTPRLMQSGRSTTQALLAVALSMGINVCNTALYFHHSSAAVFLFGSSTVNCLLAGAIILSIANFVSLLALGMIPAGETMRPTSTVPGPHKHATTVPPAAVNNGVAAV